MQLQAAVTSPPRLLLHSCSPDTHFPAVPVSSIAPALLLQSLLLVLLHSLGLPSCGRDTHWLLAGESSPARSMSAKDGQNCDSTQRRKRGRCSCGGVQSCSQPARRAQSCIEFAQRGTGLTEAECGGTGLMWVCSVSAGTVMEQT